MKTNNNTEELLFATDGQSVFRITDDSDGSEPKTLCDGSLIRIEGVERGGHHDCVLTALEMDDLAKQWMELRKMKPPMTEIKKPCRNSAPRSRLQQGRKAA